MSIKFSHKIYNCRKYAIVIIAICLALICLKPCYAWDGYDYKSKSAIEIEPNNLVREGSVIQFYDLADDHYHSAKVISLEESFHGSDLVVQDLDQKKTRTFKMKE